MKPTEDNISVGWYSNDEPYSRLQILVKNDEEGDKLKQRILQNEKLREVIVDYADIWDGPESLKYGSRLLVILEELGIKDIPEFYKKENIDKFIKELEERKK